MDSLAPPKDDPHLSRCISYARKRSETPEGILHITFSNPTRY
jgi:hypothetical protein